MTGKMRKNAIDWRKERNRECDAAEHFKQFGHWDIIDEIML
jgi:hypothetical protein